MYDIMPEMKTPTQIKAEAFVTAVKGKMFQLAAEGKSEELYQLQRNAPDRLGELLGCGLNSTLHRPSGVSLHAWREEVRRVQGENTPTYNLLLADLSQSGKSAVDLCSQVVSASIDENRKVRLLEIRAEYAQSIKQLEAKNDENSAALTAEFIRKMQNFI